MDFQSRSPRDTEIFAGDLASRLQPGRPLCLHGDLGAGKSLLARALIRALCNDPALEVPSPTFTLAQYYDTPQGPLTHFDLYRLKDPDEILELGWDEARAGLCIIEWPERLGYLMPPRRMDVYIMPVAGKPESRIIRSDDQQP